MNSDRSGAEVTNCSTEASRGVVAEDTVAEGHLAKPGVQDEGTAVTARNSIFKNHVFVDFNSEEGQASTLVVTSNDGGGVAIRIDRTTVNHTVCSQGDGVAPVVHARPPVDDVTGAEVCQTRTNLVDEVGGTDHIEDQRVTIARVTQRTIQGVRPGAPATTNRMM